MINLLPLSEKNNLKLEEKLKLTIILGFLFLLFLVCLILLLLPSKIYLENEVAARKILFSQTEKESEVVKMKDLERKINKLNQNLSKLNSFYQEKIDWVRLLEKLSQTLPSEMYLRNLSFTPLTKDYRFQVRLSGFSPTREILMSFKRDLEKEEEFKEVYFPPANWMKPENIDFNLNFKIQ